MKYKQKHGFTIVELLIVIVVIGILATIGVVAYNGISARAKVAQKKSEVSQIQKQIEVGTVDNSEFTNTEEGLYPGVNYNSGTNRYEPYGVSGLIYLTVLYTVW